MRTFHLLTNAFIILSCYTFNNASCMDMSSSINIPVKSKSTYKPVYNITDAKQHINNLVQSTMDKSNIIQKNNSLKNIDKYIKYVQIMKNFNNNVKTILKNIKLSTQAPLKTKIDAVKAHLNNNITMVAKKALFDIEQQIKTNQLLLNQSMPFAFLYAKYEAVLQDFFTIKDTIKSIVQNINKNPTNQMNQDERNVIASVSYCEDTLRPYIIHYCKNELDEIINKLEDIIPSKFGNDDMNLDYSIFLSHLNQCKDAITKHLSNDANNNIKNIKK